jgi:hypothetical protein
MARIQAKLRALGAFTYLKSIEETFLSSRSTRLRPGNLNAFENVKTLDVLSVEFRISRVLSFFLRWI